MANRKRTKKVTPSELKAYLKGALEFHDDDWTPNHTEWKRICDMIMNLKDEPPAPKNNAAGGQGQAPPQPQSAQPAPAPQQPAQPSPESNLFSPDYNPNAPPPPAMDMRPQLEQRSGTPGNSVDGQNPHSGKTYKTPDVDTSEQNYNSPFE